MHLLFFPSSIVHFLRAEQAKTDRGSVGVSKGIFASSKRKMASPGISLSALVPAPACIAADERRGHDKDFLICCSTRPSLFTIYQACSRFLLFLLFLLRFP